MSEELESAIALVASNKEGALATLEENKPFVSGIGYLYDRAAAQPYGRIYLLLSDLARHTKNLQKHSEASLLIVQEGTASIYDKPRATVQGTVQRMPGKEQFDSLKEKYLKAFPKSAIFFTLADFRFYEMEISEIHWIGGFGKAKTFS